MSTIDKLFLFQGLTQAEKEKISNSFSPTAHFKKGEVIYSQTSFPNAIGFVVNGRAFAVINNGHGLRMNNFESGTCFGVAAIFGGGEKYVSTIIAETDIEILFLTEEELKKIFLEVPKAAINYINLLSQKVRFLNQKLSLISGSNAEETVLKYLTSSVDSECYAQTPKSMTMLSKMLSISRATLYRSLDSLEANGKILRENNKIKVIKNEKNS